MATIALPMTGSKRKFARWCDAAMFWEIWLGRPHKSGSYIVGVVDDDFIKDVEFFKEKGLI